MNVLFVDSVAYRYYTADTLRTEALGGTEATVIRVARGLAARGHNVGHLNLRHLPEQEQVIDGVRHIGQDLADIKADVIIHLRTAENIADFKEEFPKARHIVWMHDLGSERLLLDPLQDADSIVCVSDFHVNNMAIYTMGLDVHRIYNPVEIPDGISRCPKIKGRLGFFSSPHKGLEQVVGAFRKLPNASDLQLVVANPGYIKSNWRPFTAPGVLPLGELSHKQVLEEMSRCEVLFYPQTSHPETFGLVLAEAAAMGTSVVTHDMGAAKEVLGERNGHYVIDCTHVDNVREAVDELLRVQPEVKADPRFALSTVLDEWEELIND